MKEKINNIKEQINNFEINSDKDLEKFRIDFLSKKGLILNTTSF